mgnify:CR=1 FL=1
MVLTVIMAMTTASTMYIATAQTPKDALIKSTRMA